MKIRNGFVSNSSSSSFCIYGTIVEKDYWNILNTIRENSPETFKKIRSLVEKWDDSKDILAWMDDDEETERPDGYGDIGEIIGEAFEDEIDIHFASGYDDHIYIGRSWRNIGGEETGNQFKKDIENKIGKILGKVKFETHEEAWS